MADDLATNKLLLVIIALLLPPLAVYLKNKSIGMTLLCLVLCFVFYIPGLLLALWVVLKD
ncbi:MAG: YqaE/Pmp3 family membrane protein [Phycisphaeraceae bacterium]|nr:YqaE/Pmp3 family membrane protein [Phycisphaeraceae bacterium]